MIVTIIWHELTLKGNRQTKMNDLEERIQKLTRWIQEAVNIVILTGASISTESGLPNARRPESVWTSHDKELPKKFRLFTSVEPNACHRAIVELQNLGKLRYLITQNVDNLHLRSGIRPELLAELHGNVTRLRCERCQTQVAKSLGLEKCSCGGKLVSSVINFGEPVPQKDLEDSFWHSSQCDLFIVIGSSLVVGPANELPEVALRGRARLVIINQGETPMDSRCHLRFDEDIAEVFPPVVNRLKSGMKKD
ncbi:MAG TPA: Sir2 family NAD-dependent protein deacetylase [Thermodesulfobacteriota bacterium]|nr:Sir2 family NAD-dependent protein deacetylase [Thermodesulfobacteriota bacterium]